MHLLAILNGAHAGQGGMPQHGSKKPGPFQGWCFYKWNFRKFGSRSGYESFSFFSGSTIFFIQSNPSD